MRLESKKHLYDIGEAGKLALQFINGRSFSDYKSDPMLRSAVERQLQIVDKALAQLFKSDPETAVRITEHNKVIAFRNILVRGYANIDDRVVWSVLDTKLRELVRSRDDGRRRVKVRPDQRSSCSQADQNEKGLTLTV